MKNRILAGLMAGVMMLGCGAGVVPEISDIIAHADEVASGTCGENLTWSLDDKGTLTISGTGEMEDYFYRGAPWHKNADFADIKNIVIEKGVTQIGAYAFCYSGDAVTMSDDVRKIGRRAFWGSHISSISLSNNLKTIDDGAFEQCELTDIVIPDSVERINSQVFRNCGKLKNVTLSNNIFYLGENAFENTIWLKVLSAENEQVLVNGVLIDGRNSSGKITIPKGVRAIGGGAFASCNKITSVTLPDSVKWIGEKAFLKCECLLSITIPDSVEIIGANAFDECELLSSVKIPESVKEIGSNIFNNCKSLESVTLPQSLLEIYNGVGYSYSTNGIGSSDPMWGFFHNCKSLQSVTLPTNLTLIGDEAFLGCDKLTEIIIPESVSRIGHAAFDGTNIKTVTVPKNVKEIGIYAFAHTPLTEVTILNPDCKILDLDGTFSNAVIWGYDGSTAESYAKKYNRTFKSLGSPENNDTIFCNLNSDSTVNASDAALVLISSAAVGAGDASKAIPPEQADVNADETVNASDAALILIYAAAVGAGYQGTLPQYFAK